MPFVEANGIRMHYDIGGEGQPLVLIAGLGYSAWMWHRLAPLLAEHYQVVTFDNRGVGQTDQPPGPYSAQMLADDTAGLLAALGVEKAAVLGHSMGGFIAQALVLSRPELVSHLVLSATNFGGPRHVPVTAEAFKVLSDISGDPVERFKRGLVVSTAPGFAEAHPEIIEAWLAWRIQNPVQPVPYGAQMAIGLGLLAEAASFEARLAQVRAPTLILFGAHDKVVPPANAELLQAKIAGAKVVILPNAGHFYPMEVPEAAAQAIHEFLNVTTG